MLDEFNYCDILHIWNLQSLNNYAYYKFLVSLLPCLIGLFTQIAQVCMTRSFHAEDAAKITPLKYIGAIYAVCIGLFVFDETLSQIVSVGIALILTGVLLNTFFVKKVVKQS